MKDDDRRMIIAVPHGFCAGVARAVDMAEAALQKLGTPLYCLNEIVHNRLIVDGLAERGVIFVKDVAEVPHGGTVLFSAHGVAPSVRDRAAQRELHVIDATCPFVTKVHKEVKHYARRGYFILLIGHRYHEEVIGVAGEAPGCVIVIESEAEARDTKVADPARVAVMTQTTLSVEETEKTMEILRERFPELETPAKSDICYATRNRQLAARELAGMSDLVLVLGARNSSNTRRLVEVARGAGGKARLITDIASLRSLALGKVRVLGITAGASTPESFVEEVTRWAADKGFGRREALVVVDENASFPLPAELR